MRGGSVNPRSPKQLPARPSSRTDTDPGEAQTDEAQLFREAVRDVRPLRSASAGASAPGNPLGRATQAAEQSSGRPRRPRPAARFSRADRLAVLEESLRDDAIDPELASGEALVFHRNGVQSAVLRKLHRGDYRVQGEIDLHGLTVIQAKQVLREFLAEALIRQWRCVRIIHGKGLRSGHRGPVLKGMVSATLRKLGPVLAYVSARQVDGGTGAVYVLLSS